MIKGIYRNREYVIGDKVIVMTFPGMGKTELSDKYPNIFKEIDASDYYWGGLSIPPCMNIGTFPGNYVDKIEEILEDNTVKANIIFVCNHIEVAQELRNRGIKFCSIISNRKIVIQALKKAKYVTHVIEFFSDIYQDFISNMFKLCNTMNIVTNPFKSVGDMFLGYIEPSIFYERIIYNFQNYK